MRCFGSNLRIKSMTLFCLSTSNMANTKCSKSPNFCHRILRSSKTNAVLSPAREVAMRLSSVASRICSRGQITSGVAESSGHESCAAGGIEIRGRAVYRVCRSIAQAHAVENVLQFIRVSVKGGQFFPRLLSRLQHGVDRFEILGARK